MEQIVAFGEQHWGNVNAENMKIIPRLFLTYDSPGNTYWPEDMTTGDYRSEQFKERLTAMVRKMAAAWDNDPRVAYIEMGIVGFRGEHHTPKPADDIQQLLISLFETCWHPRSINCWTA